MAYPLNGLAVIYRKQGKHEEVALLQRILSVRDVQFWSQHLEIKETHTRPASLRYFTKCGSMSKQPNLRRPCLSRERFLCV